MKVFCRVVGKDKYFNKVDNLVTYVSFISTSDFNTRDGFARFEFYKCLVSEDCYNDLKFLDNCTCDLAIFNKDGRQYTICSDLEKVE